MIRINAKAVLLDIEGTTSSIRFVHDEMFPFVRRQLAEFLAANWESAELLESLSLLAADHQQDSVETWLGNSDIGTQQQVVIDAINKLMDGDIKATGLKHLQGLIWKDGFHRGDLVAHLYSDTEPAIRNWVESGLDVRIYSSGSVGAQKLFFGHTIAGDLLSLFGGHYDTTTGPKKSLDSYTTIAAKFDMSSSDIVFLSDVTDELDAAKSAGMQTILSLREGNAPVANLAQYHAINSFAELEISNG